MGVIMSIRYGGCMLIRILLALSIFIFSSYVPASEMCNSQKILLSSPSLPHINRCLAEVVRNRANLPYSFTQDFFFMLLPTTKKELEKLYKAERQGLNYLKIANAIALTNSPSLIERYIDFVVFTLNSADETRADGLGLLFTLKAPEVLELLDKLDEKNQTRVIGNLSFGLLNNNYPHIDEENYKKMIVGVHWDLTEHKSIITLIESNVFRMLTE